jgi:tight adherence protein C
MLVVAFLFRSYIPGLRSCASGSDCSGSAWVHIPNFVLEYLVSKRQETLRLSLPDALDLMVVCVEAAGLDQAIVTCP